MRIGIFAVIAGMAAVTYLTRIAGFWLMGHFQNASALMSRMRYVPCAVLAAITAPAVAKGDPAEWIGFGVAILALLLTRNFLIAIAVSILSVALLR